jgi:hypothetical protein
VLLAWCVPPQPPVAPWPLIGVALTLALVFHVFVELAPARSGWDQTAAAGVVSAIGHGAVITVAMMRATDTVWPWVGAWLALAVLLVDRARCPDAERWTSPRRC